MSAEIFVINCATALSGQYVSDLPVVNATPVARQVGWYLPSALTSASESSRVANLVTYLGAAEADIGGVVGDFTPLYLHDAAGAAIDTSNGTEVLSQNEYQAGTTLIVDVVARIILALVMETAAGDYTSALTVANIQSEVNSVLNAKATSDTSGGGGNISTFDGSSDLDAGGATTKGILRVLAMGEPDAAGSFAETGVVGNHRLIGGRRRIYLRDRTSASVGEGFLRTYKDAGSLVIYTDAGVIL
mgnify:CR=1 FL=1